jgi:hypothetical protein
VSTSSSPVRRSGGATGAIAGAASQSSGGTPGVQGRTNTTAAAAGAAFGSSRSYRPSQEPYLLGLPSSNAAALDYGAFILPTDRAAARRGLFGLGPLALRAGEPNLLALLGFPDFLRAARAQAARRSLGDGDAFPEVKQVLGQQAVSDLGEGGGLTFGQLPLLALALVLFSSTLLVGAVLPPGVVARTPVSPATYARAREPLALAALGILVPVAVVALVVALS